jgi:hypothetical protein
MHTENDKIWSKKVYLLDPMLIGKVQNQTLDLCSYALHKNSNSIYYITNELLNSKEFLR